MIAELQIPPTHAVANLKHWDVFVHPNQSYVCRGVLQLKRPAKKTELTADEQVEFEQAKTAYLLLLKRDLKPDQIEESWHEGTHLQFDIVPRYRSFRIVNGAEFTDTRFGTSAEPAPEWTGDYAAKAFIIKMLVMRFKQAFLAF